MFLLIIINNYQKWRGVAFSGGGTKGIYQLGSMYALSTYLKK